MIKLVSCSVVSESLWPHGLQIVRLLFPYNSPGKNTGVGCHSLLQGLFPTQGLNPGLLHCRHVLYHLSRQESPWLNLFFGWSFSTDKGRQRTWETRSHSLSPGLSREDHGLWGAGLWRAEWEWGQGRNELNWGWQEASPPRKGIVPVSSLCMLKDWRVYPQTLWEAWLIGNSQLLLRTIINDCQQLYIINSPFA